MAKLNSNNFVVRLYYSFQGKIKLKKGKEYLYLVMEYLPGGYHKH
jgi:hypothetical protein